MISIPPSARSLLVLGVLLLAATDAHAGRVLFFGDSRTNTGSKYGTNYPKLVLAARPDLTGCVDYQNGRNTIEGLAAIDKALADCDAGGKVTDVVILLGVNDLLEIRGTADECVGRIREIADRVRKYGAREWIMTQPPAPAFGEWKDLDPGKWSREIAERLRALESSDGHYRLISNGNFDEFTKALWSSCASDKLHPNELACRTALAAGPIAVLPRNDEAAAPPAAAK